MEESGKVCRRVLLDEEIVRHECDVIAPSFIITRLVELSEMEDWHEMRALMIRLTDADFRFDILTNKEKNKMSKLVIFGLQTQFMAEQASNLAMRLLTRHFLIEELVNKGLLELCFKGMMDKSLFSRSIEIVAAFASEGTFARCIANEISVREIVEMIRNVDLGMMRRNTMYRLIRDLVKWEPNVWEPKDIVTGIHALLDSAETDDQRFDVIRLIFHAVDVTEIAQHVTSAPYLLDFLKAMIQLDGPHIMAMNAVARIKFHTDGILLSLDLGFITRILEREDETSVIAALNLLENYCDNSESVAAVLQTGALPIIAHKARTGSFTIKTHAAGAIMNISGLMADGDFDEFVPFVDVLFVFFETADTKRVRSALQTIIGLCRTAIHCDRLSACLERLNSLCLPEIMQELEDKNVDDIGALVAELRNICEA